MVDIRNVFYKVIYDINNQVQIILINILLLLELK